MKGLISRLNKEGYQTLGCCCGHGVYPMSIIIKGSLGIVREWITSKPILRKRKFYKKDARGYYYIPETRGKNVKGQF